VEPSFESNGRSDDERHLVGGRQLEERSQTRIPLREGQALGELQLVAGQRELGEDQHPRAPFGGRVDEPKVALEVGLDVAGSGERLGGG
jgi:hypothetical protein